MCDAAYYALQYNWNFFVLNEMDILAYSLQALAPTFGLFVIDIVQEFSFMVFIVGIVVAAIADGGAIFFDNRVDFCG